MKYIIIVDVIHPYYIIVSGVVKFEVKVVFVIRIFFVVFFAVLRLTLITVNSSCSLSNIRYIYTFALKFSNLFIFEIFFNLIFDISKDINIKTFLRLMENGIRFAIAILHSVFIMLAFFWGTSF